MVNDFEGETRALLDFLGVGWDDAVLDHVEHARQRGIINTPSYHQVTQPIYRDARYRWKRYAVELEPVIPILRPYIERFGYAERSCFGRCCASPKRHDPIGAHRSSRLDTLLPLNRTRPRNL